MKMVNNKQLKNKQNELDKKKWLDSEYGEDTCGSYAFCAKCDKAKEYPCANAFYLFRAKK